MTPRPRRLASIGGFSGGLLFLIATSVVSVLNFAFHVLFSRSLGPASYSELGTLLALITIAAVPLGALQLAVAHAATSAARDDGAASITRFTTIGAAGAEVVIVIASSWIAHFFHIGSPVPIVLFGAWLSVAAVTAVPAGLLVGREQFRPVAIALLVGTGAVRMALGAVMSLAHAGVDGAMLATVAGQAVTLVLLVLATSETLFDRVRTQMKVASDEGWLSVSAVTSMSVLISVDTLMARRLLSADGSGYYTAADTLGRIALFAPGAVATMAFPRFVAHAADGAASRAFLGRALGAVVAIGAAAAGVLVAAPHFTVRVLFGESYGPATSVLVPLSVAGALLGCLTLLTYFHIANRSTAALLGWLAAVLVVFVARTGTFSARRLALTDVAMIAIVTALSLIAALVAPTLGARRRAALARDVVEGPVIGPVGAVALGERAD